MIDLEVAADLYEEQEAFFASEEYNQPLVSTPAGVCELCGGTGISHIFEEFIADPFGDGFIDQTEVTCHRCSGTGDLRSEAA